MEQPTHVPYPTRLFQKPRAAPDVSIVVVSWNASRLLKRALACVDETVQMCSYEVIVIDNNSDDDSVAVVQSGFPQAHLQANTENIGFGQANNQGAAVARGRYLLLLNPDAFVHAGTIDRLVQFMDEHPEAGCAGPRLLYPDGRLQRSTTAFPTVLTELWTLTGLDRALPRSRVFGRYKMTYWEMDDMRAVDALMGACMIVRREVIDRIGLFDEQFFMYSEEVDLCYRLQQEGFKSYYLPDVTATHVWGGSSSLVPRATFLRLFRSRVQFFRKHYGARTTALYKRILFLGSLGRVILSPLVFVVTRRHHIVRAYINYSELLRALDHL